MFKPKARRLHPPRLSVPPQPHHSLAAYEDLATLERLYAVVSAHGTSPALFAFADPDRTLEAVIPGAHTMATEGLLSEIKHLIATVANGFRDANKEFDDAAFNALLAEIKRADKYVADIYTADKKDIAALPDKFPKGFDWAYFRMENTARDALTGCRAAAGVVGVVMALCRIPLPQSPDPDAFVGYVAAANATLSPLQRAWPIRFTDAGQLVDTRHPDKGLSTFVTTDAFLTQHDDDKKIAADPTKYGYHGRADVQRSWEAAHAAYFANGGVAAAVAELKKTVIANDELGAKLRHDVTTGGQGVMIQRCNRMLFDGAQALLLTHHLRFILEVFGDCSCFLEPEDD